MAEQGAKLVGLGHGKLNPGPAPVRPEAPAAAPVPGPTSISTPTPTPTLSTTPSSGNGAIALGSGAAKLSLPGPAPAAPPAKPARKPGIEIAQSAADRIRKLLSDRGTPDAALRIRVRGGGCSGLTYDMEFADAPKEKDRVFEGHGVKIFVDAKSYIFLVGTVLEYYQGKLESGFKLTNPNVQKSCSCGESFTV